MNGLKLGIAVIVTSLLAVGLAAPAAAQPPEIPHTFYGTVEINGELSMGGDNVAAVSGGDVVASTLTDVNGEYTLGVLTDYGTVGFYVNDVYTEQDAEVGLKGEFTEVNLTVTTILAEFDVSALSVSPEEVKPGETVTVSAEITNIGGQSGSYEVEFKVEGTLEDTESVALSPDESTTMQFTTSRDEGGTYTVKVDGLTGSFEVKKPAVFPWPAVVAVILIVIVIVAICYWKREEMSKRLRKA